VKKQEIKIYQKVTVGFVAQKYKINKKGKYNCTHQVFVAGDEVTYEDDEGNSITIPQILDKEEYFPFEMEQPIEKKFPTPQEKLELALAIMSERQIGQYRKGIGLLAKGVKIDDMPGDIFID
jgi:hypothetical protein